MNRILGRGVPCALGFYVAICGYMRREASVHRKRRWVLGKAVAEDGGTEDEDEDEDEDEGEDRDDSDDDGDDDGDDDDDDDGLESAALLTSLR